MFIKVLLLHVDHCAFLSTENAAEKELWRENTDHKDSGEFLTVKEPSI